MTTERKRLALLEQLPPEKRDAKRRDLEQRAAKARAKYVPRGTGAPGLRQEVCEQSRPVDRAWLEPSDDESD